MRGGGDDDIGLSHGVNVGLTLIEIDVNVSRRYFALCSRSTVIIKPR